MRERTTPLANAFFRMVLFGSMAGMVTTAVLVFLDQLPSWPLNIPAMLVPAIIGSFVGMAIAGSAAGCAIGLRTWATAKLPVLTLPGAALSGALGPILLVSLILGPAWQAPVPTWVWLIILPANSLAAMYFTRPLRRMADHGTLKDIKQ